MLAHAQMRNELKGPHTREKCRVRNWGEDTRSCFVAETRTIIPPGP